MKMATRSPGELIFRTDHGSHLYGFEHEGSDHDVYEVYEGNSRKLRQTTDGNLDLVRGSLSAFMLRASSGAHQSAEALFSKQKDFAPGMEEKWGHLFDNFRLGAEAYEKYERTIKKFAFGNFKQRRHAGRLALNLWEMRVSGSGRFNPRIHSIDRHLITAYAKLREGDELLAELHDLINPQRGFDI